MFNKWIPKQILNQADEFKDESAQPILIGEHRRILKNSSGSFKMGNGIIFQSFLSGALGVFRFGAISVKEASKRELEEYFTKSHTDFKNAFDNLEVSHERNKKVFRK